jgi:hypothetical protein
MKQKKTAWLPLGWLHGRVHGRRITCCLWRSSGGSPPPRGS